MYQQEVILKESNRSDMCAGLWLVFWLTDFQNKKTTKQTKTKQRISPLTWYAHLEFFFLFLILS